MEIIIFPIIFGGQTPPIIAAMVVYGLLTYTQGKVFIPNRELMFKYEEILRSEKSLGKSKDIPGRSWAWESAMIKIQKNIIVK